MNSDKNSPGYSEIPIIHSPENVLEQLVADLRHPVSIVENSLPKLQQITKQADGNVIFSQLEHAVVIGYQRIQSVIDYLNSRLKNDILETENVAENILCEFTHELRECVAPLEGFIAVFQRIELSEDQVKNDIGQIELFGKSLIKVFSVLEKNWQQWLESGEFYSGYGNEFEEGDNESKSYDNLESQQTSQDTIILPEDRWHNAGLLDG